METIATDIPFTAEERSVLSCLAALMIPADTQYNLPAASDPEVMVLVLTKLSRQAGFVSEQLTAIEARAQAEFSMAMTALDDDDAMTLVDHFGHDHPFLQLFAAAITEAYYQDARVLASLDLDARPPFPEGNELEQGDWSLLDPVKVRPKMYRDI